MSIRGGLCMNGTKNRHKQNSTPARHLRRAGQVTPNDNIRHFQSATVLGAWDPADAQFGDTTHNVTLNAIGAVPPYNPYPDPSTNIYNGFSPIGIVGPWWSGAGIWNSKNHLLAMVEGGDSATNELYGFNGQDIINFCSEYGINYSESSRT